MSVDNNYIKEHWDEPKNFLINGFCKGKLYCVDDECKDFFVLVEKRSSNYWVVYDLDSDSKPVRARLVSAEALAEDILNHKISMAEHINNNLDDYRFLLDEIEGEITRVSEGAGAVRGLDEVIRDCKELSMQNPDGDNGNEMSFWER